MSEDNTADGPAAAAPAKEKKRVTGKVKKAGAAAAAGIAAKKKKKRVAPPARIEAAAEGVQKPKKLTKRERERRRKNRNRKLTKKFLRARYKETVDIPQASFRKFVMARFPDDTSVTQISARAIAELQPAVEFNVAKDFHSLALMMMEGKRYRVLPRHIRILRYSKYPLTDGDFPAWKKKKEGEE